MMCDHCESQRGMLGKREDVFTQGEQVSLEMHWTASNVFGFKQQPRGRKKVNDVQGSGTPLYRKGIGLGPWSISELKTNRTLRSVRGGGQEGLKMVGKRKSLEGRKGGEQEDSNRKKRREVEV